MGRVSRAPNHLRPPPHLPLHLPPFTLLRENVWGGRWVASARDVGSWLAGLG